jgi:peptide/nickel transport system permease protein
MLQYLHWLSATLAGDFGRSVRPGGNVLSAILQRLPVTLELVLFAQLIALAIGVPLGILCAVRSGGAFDRLISAIAFGKLSVPAFMLAIVLIYVFSVRLKLLPARKCAFREY